MACDCFAARMPIEMSASEGENIMRRPEELSRRPARTSCSAYATWFLRPDTSSSLFHTDADSLNRSIAPNCCTVRLDPGLYVSPRPSDPTMRRTTIPLELAF